MIDKALNIVTVLDKGTVICKHGILHGASVLVCSSQPSAAVWIGAGVCGLMSLFALTMVIWFRD